MTYLIMTLLLLCFLLLTVFLLSAVLLGAALLLFGRESKREGVSRSDPQMQKEPETVYLSSTEEVSIQPIGRD
jgi:hypothetical protein